MTTITALGVLLLAQQGWLELGGSATGGGISQSPIMSSGPKVAIDAAGNPAIAWSKELPDGRYQVYFKRWNGSAWVELAGSATGDGLSAGPGDSYAGSLALDSAGQPAIAWWSIDPLTSLADIFLKRWNGAAWVDAGGSPGSGLVAATPGDSGAPSLALDASDRPFVAWRELPGAATEIYLLRWSGSAWEELGGSGSGGGVSSNTGYSHNPALDIDASGRPALSWIDNSSGKFGVYFKRWSGSDWVELGGSASGAGASASTVHILSQSMRVDAGGTPVIAWADKTGGPYKVLVRRWDGSAWSGLGISADPGGISGSPLDGNSPSVALDAAGQPVIAWSQYTTVYPTPTNVEIWLRRWNGTDWVEVAGSGTGAGVSMTPTTSPSGPSVDVNATGTIAVAWTEGLGSGHYELYLRRHVNALPVLGGPAQLQLDTQAPVAEGAILVGQSGVLVRGFAGDVDGDTVRLEVEVRPFGTPFSGAATAQGPLGAAGLIHSVPADGLPIGESYYWQARVVDDLGAPSAWTTFGSAQADFILRDNDSGSTTNAGQRHGESGAELPIGAQILAAAGVRLEATTHDPDGDGSRVEFEVRLVGTAFTGTATHESALTADGSVASTTILLPAGSWRWRHRTVDEFDAASGWTDFGGNGQDADFEVLANGSAGGRACGQSSGAASILLPLTLIALLAIPCIVRR